MALDAERGPALELFRDAPRRLARHETERMAAEINERAAAVARVREARAKAGEIVGRVERACARYAALEFAARHSITSAE
jgi:hypothetical protein